MYKSKGQVTQARIDDMTLRILIPMFAAQLFDVVNNGNLSVNVQTDAHTMLARDLATEATVLLQNVNQILPIKTKNVKVIAVLGDAGDKSPIVAGGGSGKKNKKKIKTKQNYFLSFFIH